MFSIWFIHVLHFFIKKFQGLFSACIFMASYLNWFFFEVDLHTQMLVSILGFSKTPIACKHKFNPIYKQYKDDKIANEIWSNFRHPFLWCIGQLVGSKWKCDETSESIY
jgi:hypothetical protein